MCLRSCWVTAENPSVSLWKSCVPAASLPGLFWSSSQGTTQERGSFSWSIWTVACYLWLGFCPSIEFLCVEHTRNLSLPPPPKSISVVWKAQNISLTLTSRRRSCISPDTRRLRSSTQREIGDHRAVQGWSESCGLIKSGRIIAFPQFQGCLHSVYAITVGIYPHRILF